MPAADLRESLDGSFPASHENATLAPGAGRTKQRQSTLAQIARDSFAATSVEALFFHAARLLAQNLDHEYAATAYCQNGGFSLRWQCCDHLADTLPKVEYSTRSHDPAASLWAYAMAQDQPFVLVDLDHDARPDAAALREAGAASGVIAPVLARSSPRGAIGMFSTRARSFTQEDLTVLDSAAVLLASSAARCDAEQALAEQTRFLAEVDNLDGLVAVVSPVGIVENINEACRWLTGFADHEVRGKPFWQSLLSEPWAAEVQDALDRLRQGEAATRLVAPLRTRGRPTRKVAWTFTIVQHEDGRMRAAVAHGIERPADGRELNPALSSPALAEKNRVVLSRLEQCLRDGCLPSRELLDELLELRQIEENTPLTGPERRSRVRRPYPYVQQIAPWNGHRLPHGRAFFDVRCRDIAASGFSFFLPRKPHFERLVVALGADQHKAHVLAEVRHVTPFDADGHKTYLVGCEFLARVYY